MVGKVAVIGEQEFDDWLNGLGNQHGGSHAVDGSLAQEGQQLFLKLQCIKCHSANNQAAAPVLENLFGSRIPLKGGGAEIVDAEYIRQSILKPRARVAQGWEPIMPSYEGQVSEADLNALVAYIRSLHKGGTPDRTEQFPKPVGAPTERSLGEKKE
jgi:cytochrome c oxidase subunit 2